MAIDEARMAARPPDRADDREILRFSTAVPGCHARRPSCADPSTKALAVPIIIDGHRSSAADAVVTGAGVWGNEPLPADEQSMEVAVRGGAEASR